MAASSRDCWAGNEIRAITSNYVFKSHRMESHHEFLLSFFPHEEHVSKMTAGVFGGVGHNMMFIDGFFLEIMCLFEH